MSNGSESDSSNGTKSKNPGMLDSVIRIRTLHALSIVVVGVLTLSGIFWDELKELEGKVDDLNMKVVSARSVQIGVTVLTEDELEVPRNETHTQNSE